MVVIIWNWMLSSGNRCYHLGWMLSSGTGCFHLEWLLLSGAGYYHLELDVIIWNWLLSSGMVVIIWNRMLSSGTRCYHLEWLEKMYKDCYLLCYHLNVIIWGDNIIIAENLIHSESSYCTLTSGRKKWVKFYLDTKVVKIFLIELIFLSSDQKLKSKSSVHFCALQIVTHVRSSKNRRELKNKYFRGGIGSLAFF